MIISLEVPNHQSLSGSDRTATDSFQHTTPMLKDGISGKAIDEMLSNLISIKIPPNKDELVPGRGAPFFPLDIEARTPELEDIAEFTFLKPENAFGSKHILR